MPETLDKAGLFQLTAEKIERDPALLETALQNIDCWLKAGSTGRRQLLEWRGFIVSAQKSAEGLQALTTLLRDDSPAAEHRKEFSPFAGILTTAERRPFIEQCAFTH
jgi:hypothetical protein